MLLVPLCSLQLVYSVFSTTQPEGSGTKNGVHIAVTSLTISRLFTRMEGQRRDSVLRPYRFLAKVMSEQVV